MDTDTVLSRREATLRAGATICLAGVALVQAIGLPSLFVQGRQVAVLSMAAMALCIGLGWALAAAPAGAAPDLWRLVAGVGVLVLAGWAAPRAFAVPGLEDTRGDWTAMPGALCGALALACLALAAAAARPTRSAVRGLATAAAVLAALAPATGVVLVGLGPGTAGGETVLASGGHIHSHGSPESAIEFQPIAGGRGGHFVYRAVATPRHSPLALAALFAGALIFTYGAVGHLRRRAAPGEPMALAGVGPGLA